MEFLSYVLVVDFCGIVVNICSFCDINDGKFVKIFLVGFSDQSFCLFLLQLKRCVFLAGCKVLKIYLSRSCLLIILFVFFMFLM